MIGDTALFERNLEAVERMAPRVAARLRLIDRPVSQLVERDGGLNIDIGHTDFYATDVDGFVEDQVEQYAKAPFTIDFGWPHRGGGLPLMTRLTINRFNDLAEEAGIEYEPENQATEAGFLVSLGVGLGRHIGKLMALYEVRSLILVEQFVEFLWHSMHLEPWHEWVETLEERGGRLMLIVHDDPQNALTELVASLRFENGGLLDGTYVYTHYRSLMMRELNRGLDEQMVYIGANRGFFEDEMVMMYNAVRNCAKTACHVWEPRPRHAKTVPAIVVGAGPSVDGCLDKLRELADRAVIIACGSGAEVCFGAGVTPDFHVELENTSGQAEILSRTAARHPLRDVTLVGAFPVNPGVTELFDKVILFSRDTVSSSRFMSNFCRPVFQAVPTVTNGGVRFAVNMGFREIYLFGCDFGTREPEDHHSKVSAYYTDQEFMDSFPEHLAARKFERTVEGNFGGLVSTHNDFLFGRLFMMKAIAQDSGARVYNCSDGASITGARPLLPKLVRTDATPEKKAAAIEQVFAELAPYGVGELVDRERLDALRETGAAFYDDLRAALDRFEANEEVPVFEIYGELLDLVIPEYKPAGSVEDVLAQFSMGTILTMFQAFHRMYRRSRPDQRRAVFEIYLKLARENVDEMADYVDGLCVMLQAAADGKDPVPALA